MDNGQLKQTLYFKKAYVRFEIINFQFSIINLNYQLPCKVS